MNLFVYDLGTKETRQLTRYTDFDVKFPSLGPEAIVFENGGYLYRFDLATEQAVKIPVVINEDFVSGRGGLIDVSKNITNFEISPDGNRALFGARGDVFTVPAKNGPTRNLTQTPGVHERNSRWSPDGKWIAYISDASGEDEIYVQAQDGLAPAVQITEGGDTYKYQPLWSPDSKKLLWADKKLRLQYVDVDSKKITLVNEATAWEITAYAWSPDSKWIAFARPEEKQMTTVYLYSVETQRTVPVTDGWFTSTAPSFSSDGKYLFFVSNRTLNPVYSQTEWNHAYVDLAKIYLVTLARDTKSPFAPKSDEVKPATTAEKPKEEKKKEEAQVPTVKVDVEGIQSRIAVLPVTGANYWNIQSSGDKLFAMRRSSKDEKAVLVMYDFGKEKETELGSFTGYELSADGKKMLVGMEGGSYAIIDLPSAKIEVKDKLNLGDMKVRLDRYAEWSQIYEECWRQMRDFFYDPGMHGVDWKKIKEQYRPLVAHVNHRADLTYVIGEMIGELNAGHTYVGGGEYPKPERIPLGLLGARIERDAGSGYYRIMEILKGQNWDKALRSPLTDIGVDAREKDYILAVDGRPTNQMTNLFDAFIGKAGKQVTLTLNAQPVEAGSRTTVVVPTDDEQSLYYLKWVEGNIEKVSKATNGRVGYVHIPDMGVPGLNEFVKYYYPQLRKEGLIVDVRGNGGGNVSPQIIERLRREAAMIGIARNAAPSFNPDGTLVGPKVMLIDEFSASDGDIVAYRFRQYKLGPIVGKRTWGGVVGIRGTLPLLDGGYLNKPEFSRYDLEGREWIMEGVGVEPDIMVENDPAREFAGDDQQLNKGIELVLAELSKNPPKLAPPPPAPKK
jgi:tricorn protease